MTQSSRPQADNAANGFIDSGPYSRDQWSKKLIIENVGDAVTVRGPFAGYLNRLEVTNPAGVTIQVDTGAGYCNGSLLDNTAAVSFTATAPAANPRIDIVCIVENNTNAAVSNGTAANGWIFPTVLTDYNGLSSVPAYSARLVIVKGAENAAPVAPALDQSSALYMIPLAQYQISVAPVISALTDSRDYVDAVMKYQIVPATVGYNVTDGTAIAIELDGFTPATLLSAASHPALEFPDSKLSQGVGIWTVPSDFIEGLTITSLVTIDAGVAGDIYGKTKAIMLACDGSEQSAVSSASATTLQTTGINCINDISTAAFPPAWAEGQLLAMEFMRDATDILDTLGDVAYLIGFRIEYLGYR